MRFLAVACAFLLMGAAPTGDVAVRSLKPEIQRAADMAASGRFPTSMITTNWTESNAAGEPYIFHCQGKPNKMIVYLHTWSGNYQQLLTLYPELKNIPDSCVVSPNFFGPNNNPNACGSDAAMDRIMLVIREMKYKTGLTRVYLTGASGGGYASLMFMARYPGFVHRASIWVPINNLAEWYAELPPADSMKTDMVNCIGHAPSGPTDPDYLARSPAGKLSNLTHGPTPVFINTGALDTTTLPHHGSDAAALITANCPDCQVTSILWPSMGHAYQPSEAIKQLLIE